MRTEGVSRSKNAPATVAQTTRMRLHIRGVVQGVGFRPFVHRLAARYGLAGFARNDPDGVRVEVEGLRHDAFLASLRAEAPPLARIDSIDIGASSPRGDRTFSILSSDLGRSTAQIPPDTAICATCLAELFDPGSRFYLYPFVSCSHCGPRFSIARALPYDRVRTSMAPFHMCDACADDYGDTGNRRFHTETIACPKCGPRPDKDADVTVSVLRNGGIVALKGVGGFQLLCDARNEHAVRRLRAIKARDAKPFAIMAANTASVVAFAEVTPSGRALLEHRARPIALLKSHGAFTAGITDNLRKIGVMLPATPLHYLLFHAAAGYPRGDEWLSAPVDLTLVVTSANMDGAPMITDNAKAQKAFGHVVDLVVGHNLDIVARVDDSVMQVIDGSPAFLRRARGFAPDPITLATDGPTTLALGGHLKTTITVTRGREAFLSPHIGDLDTPARARAFRDVIRQMLTMLDVTPELVACDGHPDFISTLIAEEMGLPLFRAQHHAAHIAAIAAEHGVVGPILGVAFDGYGMGDDGEAWGGELLRVDGGSATRLGHLAPLPSPGGDRAARETWRMGLAALATIGALDRSSQFIPDTPRTREVIERLKRYDTPTTTAMGRLFDAAAAIAGLYENQSFEGQAAMRFEALVEHTPPSPHGWRLAGQVLDFSPILATIVETRVKGQAAAELFHGAVIEGCAAWIGAAARAHGVTQIALGGGCFVNRILADGLAEALRAQALHPLFARAAPTNDGGLSLGQAAMARAAFADMRSTGVD
jgi:hydrogenase maturation protein HypF